MDNVWEVIAQAYPNAVRSRSSFAFELVLSGGTANSADFNTDDLTFSQFLIYLNGDVQFAGIDTINDTAIEGNETFSFQPVLKNDQFALDLRGSSGTIARLNPDQINALFAAAGGITFNIGALTGTILDNDDDPTNLSLSNAAIAENSAIGTVIGSFSTTDPDTPSGFTYALVAGTGATDNAAFTIDGNQLKLAIRPDFETKPSYSIRVRTTDPNNNTYEKSFTISITDVNEFAVSTPIDNNPAANTVAENTANGTLVGITAFAQDLDGTNNTVTYSLEDNAGGRFAINASSGVVSVADGTLLDFEAQDSHAIVVKATSSDGSSRVEAFAIGILDSDDFIVGGAGNDVFYGGAQNDTLSGLGGDDILVGGAGNDSLAGGNGNDLLYGEGGNDTLNGGAGNDYFYGGAGNDFLYLGTDTARDRVYYTAGEGQDRIFQFSRTYDQIIFSGIPNITVRAVSGSTQFRNFTSGQLLVTIEGVTGFSAADVGASKALTGAVFSFLQLAILYFVLPDYTANTKDMTAFGHQ